MAERKFKYDIFNILGRLSQKQRDFSEDELKAIQPLVVTRWLTGTSSERQITMINMFANRYCFSLQHHKELLINLMTIACPGKFARHNWVKRTAKSSKTKLSDAVVASYYHYPLRRATEAANMLDDDTIIGYAEEMGYQKEQIRDLKKELKTR